MVLTLTRKYSSDVIPLLFNFTLIWWKRIVWGIHFKWLTTWRCGSENELSTWSLQVWTTWKRNYCGRCKRSWQGSLHRAVVPLGLTATSSGSHWDCKTSQYSKPCQFKYSIRMFCILLQHPDTVADIMHFYYVDLMFFTCSAKGHLISKSHESDWISGYGVHMNVLIHFVAKRKTSQIFALA